MISNKLAVLLMFILFCLAAIPFSACAQPKLPVVSYIRTWPIGSDPADIRKGRNWAADDIRGDLVSTLNIAFGLLKGNKIEVRDLKGFPNLFEEVAAAKAAYPHLKFNLSVGGWGAEGFSDMALTAESRAEFVENAISWITKYNLDGLDIDWEYPVGPSWGQEIKSRPEDAENYIALLTDLRTAFDSLSRELGRPLTVTTAVPASTWFPAVIDLVAVQEQVDYLKLMSYDYYGTWSATTGHAANLYNNPDDPEWGGWSTDQAVRMYLNAGVKPEKLLMGVPFYGRGWRGVGPENNGLFQSYKSGLYGDGLNWMDMQDKIFTDPSFVRHWDDTAKAPYVYNGDVFITYEDEESLACKVAYAKEMGLAGIMIWEYGHDLRAELLQALNDSINGIF